MIIALLIIDSTIPRISVYTGGIHPLNYYLVFFIGIVLMYGLMQYIVIAFVRQKIRNSNMYRKTKLVSSVFKFVSTVQFVLFFLLIFIIFQMIFGAKFNMLLLKTTVYISYFMGFTAMGILAYKYLIWARENHSSLVVMYLLATSMICLNSIFTVLSLNLQYAIRPDSILYARNLAGGFTSGTNTFSQFLTITYILSFLFTWVATAILLYSYYNKTNKLIYWVAMTVPGPLFL